MTKTLEARVSKLEQATIGRRAFLSVWGDPGEAEIQRRVAELAQAEGIPPANVDVVQAKWLEADYRP